MKRFLLALALLAPAHTAMAQEPPGLISQEIAAPHHDRKMDLAVWYPAEGGKEILFAENPVFKGGLVRDGARPRAGAFLRSLPLPGIRSLREGPVTAAMAMLTGSAAGASGRSARRAGTS